MSHDGVYLGGLVSAPGVERTAPRPQDRPPADGRVQRDCLTALAVPGSIRDVAARLGWPLARARSWVHVLVHAGQLQRVGWTHGQRGHTAGQYQRVNT